jgi:hypothetical protein
MKKYGIIIILAVIGTGAAGWYCYQWTRRNALVRMIKPFFDIENIQKQLPRILNEITKLEKAGVTEMPKSSPKIESNEGSITDSHNRLTVRT